MQNLEKDYYGNNVILPNIGSTVLRDGYPFTVTDVRPINEIGIIADITLKGQSGEVGVGYYDYLRHKKA